MSGRGELDGDDDFSDIYKAYTGPMGSNATNVQEKATQVKRSSASLDEEMEAIDPCAVPTDFTSREAKVWEAKSKATERNWKRRKEEEMICKLCGESGHFTQGCPSTLGASRKSQDFFERVPARDSHVKALFTQEVIQKIEDDVGCKIKIEEKFIIVSGKNRLVLKKGVDAVHKVKEDSAGKDFQKPFDDLDTKRHSSSPISHSRSFGHRSPAVSRLGRSDSQSSNRSPHGSGHYPSTRYSRQEKVTENSIRGDLQKFSSSSPYAHNSDGGKWQSSNVKSPVHPSYGMNSSSLYEGNAQDRSGFRPDGYDHNGGTNMQPSQNFGFPKTMEELELLYKREAMELTKIRDKEVDDEISGHRQAVREIRENYMEKLSMLKASHSNMWANLLHLESQRRQKLMNAISSSNYKQSRYSEFDNASGSFHHSGTSIHSRIKYPNTMDNYPSRSYNTHQEFPHHRSDDNGRPSYNRY